jgi:hypothetical protein
MKVKAVAMVAEKGESLASFYRLSPDAEQIKVAGIEEPQVV